MGIQSSTQVSSWDAAGSHSVGWLSSQRIIIYQHLKAPLPPPPSCPQTKPEGKLADFVTAVFLAD